MRIPLIPAFLAAAAVTAAAAPAFAAPPSCEKILDEGLRRSCVERVERCEPLKTAAERDDCYRGPRAPRGTPLATAGVGAPVALAPAPAPAAQTAAVQPPAAPVKENAAKENAVKQASVKPVPPPPAPTPSAPRPVAPQPTLAQPVVAAPPSVAKPSSATAVPPTALAPRTAAPTALAPAHNAPVHNAPVHAAPPAPATVTPAAMAVLPRPAPAVSAASPEQVVRAFYDALSRADGVAANSALIPEKRNAGAYEPGAIARYYAAMRDPLRVVALHARDPGLVQVHYTYTHASGRRCDGTAEVAVTQRDGAPLIERIKALNGC